MVQVAHSKDFLSLVLTFGERESTVILDNNGQQISRLATLFVSVVQLSHPVCVTMIHMGLSGVVLTVCPEQMRERE